MLYTPLEDWIGALPHKVIVQIWNATKLEDYIRPAKGRERATLARDIVAFFEAETLAQASVREALLYAHEKPAIRLCAQHPTVTRRQNDWARKLSPAWRRGSIWARRFCAAFDLDPAYAGSEPLPTPPALEVLTAEPDLPPMQPFQKEVSVQILDTLRNPEPCRAMASLPTGAGKTRVAMEAIVQYQEEVDGVVLWIGTTAEICEQAIRSYKSVYLARKPDFEARIQRLWGSYSLHDEFESGLAVASIQKATRLNQKSAKVRNFLDSVVAVFFDEAHHAVAPTYKDFVKTVAGGPKSCRLPLIGLTATPGRGLATGNAPTQALVNAFQGNLLKPRCFEKRNVVNALQEEEVISRIVKRKREGAAFELTRAEQDHIEKFAVFPNSLLERVGKLQSRNNTILRQITMDPNAEPTLVFACDVRQAEALAYEWRKRGCNGRSITANTHRSLRRKWIREFVEGELRVLVNVGTLATGFDAPIVRRIIMARPTTSSVLFEQMVGRGLRGPKFGGTEKCTVIDIVDSFSLHGPPSGYTRYVKSWLSGKH